VLVAWGSYACRLHALDGGALAETTLDLRQAARVFAGGKVGTLEEFVAANGLVAPSPAGRGRAGRRLAEIVAVVRHLVSRA
jgi:hypothetical protein